MNSVLDWSFRRGNDSRDVLKVGVDKPNGVMLTLPQPQMYHQEDPVRVPVVMTPFLSPSAIEGVTGDVVITKIGGLQTEK